MGIKIVREPSETPNISNIDDIIALRYAYGNQNGYIQGIGRELEAEYSDGTFTVYSGRVVLQGVEVDIDANGISTPIDTGTETRYYKIYLKVNLENLVAKLESYYSTVGYAEIVDPESGDLIKGKDAYLLLYEFSTDYLSMQIYGKAVQSIKYPEGMSVLSSKNVTERIKGNLISDIFSGTKAKKALEAEKINTEKRSEYNITEKGLYAVIVKHYLDENYYYYPLMLSIPDLEKDYKVVGALHNGAYDDGITYSNGRISSTNSVSYIEEVRLITRY
jgi:hypothetical protein